MTREEEINNAKEVFIEKYYKKALITTQEIVLKKVQNGQIIIPNHNA